MTITLSSILSFGRRSLTLIVKDFAIFSRSEKECNLIPFSKLFNSFNDMVVLFDSSSIDRLEISLWYLINDALAFSLDEKSNAKFEPSSTDKPDNSC